MSRKDFEALAGALRKVRPPGSAHSEAVEVWTSCVMQVASVCLEDNSRFDKRKFLIAAGFEAATAEMVW